MKVSDQEGSEARSEKNLKKKVWRTMEMNYVGNVAEIIRGGIGKLTAPGGDPGDSRKNSGGGE